MEYEGIGQERKERLLMQARRGERGVRAELGRQHWAETSRQERAPIKRSSLVPVT